MKRPKRYQPFLALALALAASPVFAAEIKLQAPGVPNFFQVNDHVYRGAQPTGQGWDSLARLGIKVVIDLRREGEDGDHSTARERKLVEAAGMRYVHVPMNGLRAPSDADVNKVLALFNGPDPVFVHCKKGKDRTGTVVACYRMSHDRWDNKRAMAEAKAIGLHWVEIGMKRYINRYRVETPAAAPAVAGAPAVAAAGSQN